MSRLDVDPEYLQEHSWDIGDDPDKLQEFIARSLERVSSLPSRKQYEKRKTVQAEQNKIRSMRVGDFLERYDDPHEHFASTDNQVNDLYKLHAVYQLRKKFPGHHQTDIDKALQDSNYHYVPAIKRLERLSLRKGKRKQAPMPQRPAEMDQNFLLELVYSRLEPQIRRHQAKLEKKHQKAVEEARKTGGLFECKCCFDGDCLLAEVAMCDAGHMFCRDCLRRGANVQIGDQKTQIDCLSSCDEKFPLQLLQATLRPNVFSRLLQRRQLEEIQAAGLDDLVQCPFCNFATIMPDPNDKVKQCYSFTGFTATLA